ncbi:MAG TPA: SgcJ/EcaC family oxidoreductase [Gemmatimonadales bacterium]
MRYLLFAALALAAGCARAAEQPAAAPAVPDSATTINAATELARRYTEAWLTADGAAVAATFTESGTAAFLGFPTTTGRQGIQSLYASAFQALGHPKGGLLSVRLARAVAPGTLGVLGTSWDTFDSSGTARTTYWRWAATVRQEADGQWRFAYLMGFPDSVTRK